MHVLTFERKLKRISPAFNIHRAYAAMGFTEEASCGLYKDGEYLMGVPYNEMPEYTVRREDGRILVRGWKNVVGNLVADRRIRRRDAERVFGFYIGNKLREEDKWEPVSYA